MADSERGRQGWKQLAWWHEQGVMDLGKTVGWLPSDELSAKEVIADIWPGYLHYSYEPKRWHIWTGTHHPPDDSGMTGRTLHRFAEWYGELIADARKQVLAQVTAAMPGAESKDIGKAVEARWLLWKPKEAYAKKLRSTAGLASLRSVLSDRFGVAEPELEDAHPYDLNLRNGTLNLTTSQLRPHQVGDLLTYCLDADYRPMETWAESCPGFWRLLFRAAGEDMEIAEYLVKVLGYSMIGDNPEQLIFFLQGDTASGKSALLDIVVEILGPLGRNSTLDLIMVTKTGRGTKTEPSIRGCRLVTITETSGWNRMDEAQVKRLTGERYIAVDRNYAITQIRTRRTWLIIIATNNMPSIANADAAIKRRGVIVPMGPSIPPEFWNKQLAEQIAATEASGIVSLLAWGAQEVLAGRFGKPARVVQATEAYWEKQDTIKQLLADCTTYAQVRAEQNGQASKSRASMHTTWQVYEWHNRNGPKLQKYEFKEKMATVPGVHLNENQRVYEGFELTPWAIEQVT